MDDLLDRADRAIREAHLLRARLAGTQKQTRALAWATRVRFDEFRAISHNAEIVAASATREAVAVGGTSARSVGLARVKRWAGWSAKAAPPG